MMHSEDAASYATFTLSADVSPNYYAMPYQARQVVWPHFYGHITDAFYDCFNLYDVTDYILDKPADSGQVIP